MDVRQVKLYKEETVRKLKESMQDIINDFQDSTGADLSIIDIKLELKGADEKVVVNIETFEVIL